MAIEIVRFPIKNGGSFHTCVNVYGRVIIPFTYGFPLIFPCFYSFPMDFFLCLKAPVQPLPQQLFIGEAGAAPGVTGHKGIGWKSCFQVSE